LSRIPSELTPTLIGRLHLSEISLPCNYGEKMVLAALRLG
jgi:hypothetical protein